MTTIAAPIHDGHARPGFLDRERIIARPGFNRWLVPPAALAIHLCIGMAHGFSVFCLPLSQAIGVTNPVVCEGMGLTAALFTTSCDWRVAAGRIRLSGRAAVSRRRPRSGWRGPP